ncbi:MAG: ParM/StbA family protein, partial [Desulfobacteraceae bacterium]|nr:ParM/StbA family protein [Desulfobacteraceae bacterium]
TKAYNGKNQIIIKSIIGDAADIQFHSSIGDTSAAANLHITLNDKSYFLGDYAELQSNIRDYTLDQDKLISDFVKILAVSAAGICSDGKEPLHIVSGLPVGFLRRDTKKFKEELLGDHEITFHNRGEKDVTKNISIAKIHIIPQPIGSVFNLIFDDAGKIVNKDLAMQKLGVMDIGFKTTDFSIFDHLQYIERGSSTLDVGISKCFTVISNKLKQESNINLELYRMFKFIDSGSIKIKGREYNISNLKKRVYSHFSSAITSDLNRLWADDWDLDSILLSGGGSLELAEYLLPNIEGEIIPISKAIDARLNNVYGYLKFGRYKWGYKGSIAASAKKKKSEASQTSDNIDDEDFEAAESENTKTTKSSKGLSWLKKKTGATV